jgi:hypothetical protein
MDITTNVNNYFFFLLLWNIDYLQLTYMQLAQRKEFKQAAPLKFESYPQVKYFYSNKNNFQRNKRAHSNLCKKFQKRI